MFYFVSYIWIQQVYGQDQDPSLGVIANKNLSSVYFPNALPVANRKKYAEFYNQSNKKLSGYIMQTIFDSWREQVKKIVQFKKDRRDKLLNEIVHFWSQYSTHKMIQKSKLNEFKSADRINTLHIVFSKMKAYLLTKSSLNKRLKAYKAQDRHDLLKNTLTLWRIKYRKSIIQSEQEMIADQMYRKTHLKVFFQWHEKYLRYQQLNREDQKLENYQRHNILRACWDEMVRYKRNSLWKKSANQAAVDEHKYWLAKRALEGWISQLDKMKQKNNLYKLLKTHYAFSLKRKALMSLRTFGHYKAEQRYNDLVVVNEIVQMRQRNVLSNWHRVQTKRLAIKRLTFLAERAVKATVFRSMVDTYKYQNVALDHMISQRSVYIKLTAFNRLKLVVNKRKSIEYANQAIADRKDHWSMKKTFMCWLNKYKQLKRNYTVYAFCAIQIKNVIARDCFNSLKQYATYQKNKRISHQYYETRLKQKLLNTFYNTQLRSDKHYAAASQIATKQIYKIKSTVLKEWFRVYKQTHEERMKTTTHLQKSRIILLSQILHSWRDLTKSSLKTSLAFKALKSINDARVKERGFSTLLNNIKVLKQNRLLREKADNFYRHNIYTKVKNSWMDIVIDNRVETTKVLKIRRMHNRKLVTKCWEFMLKKTELKRAKIRALRKVTKMPAQIEYRLAVQKWKKFIKYERDLQQRVSEGQQYFKEKRLAYAFDKILQNRYITIENQKRDNEITRFYFNKQAVQIFAMLREFLEIQREKRYKFELAMNFRMSILVNKSMTSWKQYMIDNYELFLKKREVVRMLRTKKCPGAFRHWSEFAAKHKVYRLKSEKAIDCLNSHLKSKAVKALQLNTEERKDYRNLYRKAYLFHCDKLILKSLNSLKQYNSYSKIIREKRAELAATIRKVDYECRMRSVFTLLKTFNQMSKVTVNRAEGILNLKKKQRFWNYIRYYKNKKVSLKQRYNAVKSLNEKHTKKRFLDTWCQKYEIEWRIKDMKTRRDHNIMLSWFCACLREVNINRSLHFLLSQKHKVIKQDCFDAIRQNVKVMKVKKAKIRTAVE